MTTDCECETVQTHINYLQLLAHPETKPVWRTLMRKVHAKPVDYRQLVLNCGCESDNVELSYRDEHGQTICHPCFEKRTTTPQNAWYDTKAGQIPGYGELWNWNARWHVEMVSPNQI